MLVIGLTGSVGMGKSVAAQQFRAKGIAVCDADAEVHKLYEGAAVAPIEAAFPGTTAGGKVDRQKLASVVLSDVQAFHRLESIVHPLVQAAERAFLRQQFAAGARMAVLEVPLLFETGGDARVDATIVVSAPAEVQNRRVLARPGMTPVKLAAILARQLPDADKRRRASFVVDTGGTVAETLAQIDQIIDSLERRKGSAYQRFWS